MAMPWPMTLPLFLGFGEGGHLELYFLVAGLAHRTWGIVLLNQVTNTSLRVVCRKRVVCSLPVDSQVEQEGDHICT